MTQRSKVEAWEAALRHMGLESVDEVGPMHQRGVILLALRFMGLDRARAERRLENAEESGHYKGPRNLFFAAARGEKPDGRRTRWRRA